MKGARASCRVVSCVCCNLSVSCLHCDSRRLYAYNIPQLIDRWDGVRSPFVSGTYPARVLSTHTSGIFRSSMHLHSTSRGTVSYAFSRSTNTIYTGLCPSLYFSHIVLMTNMASVVTTPGLKPNCPSDMPTMSLSLWSTICSQSFIVWLNSLNPL